MTSLQEYNAQVEANHKWNFIWLALDNMVFFFIFMGLSPYTILPFYIGKFTDSKVLIGLIPTVYLVGSTLPQIGMAKFLKGRRERKKYMIILAAIQRLGIMGIFLLSLLQPKLNIPFTPFIVIFFLCYALENVAGGFYYPAWADFLAKAITRGRGLLFGLSNFLGGLMGLGLGWLLSFLLDRYPFQHAIPIIFGISFIASVISLTAIVSWREVIPPDEYFKGAGEVEGSYSKAFADKNFVHYLVWRGLMVILEIATPYYTLSALDELSLNAGQVGIFTTILSSSEAVMNAVWGWLGDRRGFLDVVKVSALAGICGAFLAIFFPSLLTYYAVFFLIGTMICGLQISMVNIVYEFSPNNMIPLYTAICMISLTPLSSIVPTLGGVIADSLGYNADFWLAGVLGMVSLVGLSLRVRNPKKLSPTTAEAGE
jgi:MFS family permease